MGTPINQSQIAIPKVFLSYMKNPKLKTKIFDKGNKALNGLPVDHKNDLRTLFIHH